MWFKHNKLTVFNDTIKIIEKPKGTAVHSACYLNNLLEMVARKASSWD